MKRVFFVLFTLLFTNFCFSQNDSSIADTAATKKKAKTTIKWEPSPYKPAENDFGISFNLSGLINNIALNTPKDANGNDMLLLRYYIKDDLSFRLGLGINANGTKYSTLDSVGTTQVQWDSTFKKTDFFIAPGIEKHLLSTEKLDAYVAAYVEIGLLGKSTMSSKTVTTDTTGTGTRTINAEMPGGWLLSENIVVGLNYFFTKKLSIGAEYGLGLVTSFTGGERVTFTEDIPISGSKTVTKDVGSDVTSGTVFKVNSTAAITLSYFFRRK
ncbi:MAG: hypothetical protein COA57_13040 [Flavobacteriales bacterium]|nr:MAG: hypothetical protein COA57_13040 [Flavobacteriales bacterium]